MGSLKRQRESEPTTLMSLGDDMLAEILRRLPSQPSLARAAFACPRLLNVASSTPVANAFISPASLLGYYVSVHDSDIPSFHRALLRSDRDVAGIVRRGDFHLAGFEDYEWRLMDCRHGLLLLTSDRCMAVFDPLSSSRLRIPHCTSMGGKSSAIHCFLLACGAATDSFRVLCLESTAGGRVRAHVYSSSMGEWRSHSPATKGIKPPRRGDQNTYKYHYLPMHAGRRIYWRTCAEMLTALDVDSMEFSHQALPDKVKYSSSRSDSYALGDMEDGTTCFVSLTTTSNSHQKLHMRVWFLKEEDGSSSWELQRRLNPSEWDLLADVPRLVKVRDVTVGVVLLCMGSEKTGLRYRAFRLKDILKGKSMRQSLFLADFLTSSGWVHPYFMAWPRPILKAADSTENACTRGSDDEPAAGSIEKKQV